MRQHDRFAYGAIDDAQFHSSRRREVRDIRYGVDRIGAPVFRDDQEAQSLANAFEPVYRLFRDIRSRCVLDPDLALCVCVMEELGKWDAVVEQTSRRTPVARSLSAHQNRDGQQEPRHRCMLARSTGKMMVGARVTGR
jgi:hypothetical protein